MSVRCAGTINFPLNLERFFTLLLRYFAVIDCCCVEFLVIGRFLSFKLVELSFIILFEVFQRLFLSWWISLEPAWFLKFSFTTHSLLSLSLFWTVYHTRLTFNKFFLNWYILLLWASCIFGYSFWLLLARFIIWSARFLLFVFLHETPIICCNLLWCWL